MAQDQTSRYVYDDDGRLRAVIAASGEVAVYEYDAAGNFTAIRRLNADALELLTFAPRSGVVGTRVVFYGVGFGAGVSSVTFGGGAVGTLIGFTSNTITALVPEGAITGPITITTARGQLTTATPFVVQGISLNPREATLLEGDSIQFNATVILPSDNREVSWSVNRVEGGNDAVGRITSTGLYTAPLNQRPDLSVAVEAVSLAFPEFTGLAMVRVRSLSDFRFTLSPGVSIGKGAGFTNMSVLSQGISIGKGAGYTYGAALSRGVSVGKGEGISAAGVFARSVSLTKGPVISAVTPSSITQGSSLLVSINGANFGGANAVRLLNADGGVTSGIAVSNILVSGNGNSLTVNLSVESGTLPGRKIIVVSTPTAHSVINDVNVNTIQIIAP